MIKLISDLANMILGAEESHSGSFGYRELPFPKLLGLNYPTSVSLGT